MQKLFLFLIFFVGFTMACTGTETRESITQTETIVTTPSPEPTNTPQPQLVPTNTLPPVPTELMATFPPPPTITAVPTADTSTLPLPIRPPADEVTLATTGHIAFVQNDSLYIQDVIQTAPPLLVDSCVDKEFCSHDFLKWSPDGQYLLYYRSENFESSEFRLASLDGSWWTVGTEARFIQPAAWSPDGNRIVYLRDTGTTQEVETENEAAGGTVSWPGPVMEVMIVDIQDNVISQSEAAGRFVLPPGGCGGGGRSPSAVLYENEGGTAYGYRMGVLEWTAQNILLYTLDCTNIGVGRYDLTNATPLDPLDMPIRSLVLSSDKNRWFGVSGNTWVDKPGNNELVTGTPEETAVTIIPTSNPVEMVFMGNQSGKLYFTSREILEEAIPQNANVAFRFYATTLWQMDVESGSETAVYQAEDLAFARIQETANGNLSFVRIENDRPLHEAVVANYPVEAQSAYQPQRHIVVLNQTGELRHLLPNAGSIAITQ